MQRSESIGYLVKYQTLRDTFKVEKDTENRTSLESTISAYSKIPQEVLNTIDDDGLHHLISDFISFRDDYLQAVDADLTNAYINSDPPPWEDYTEETDHQIEAELQRTKEKTDTVLQIFLNEWEKAREAMQHNY